MEILAKNIAFIRKKIEKTQKELAETFAVSEQTVANWENNRRTPDVEILISLAKMGNVSLDWLLTGEEKEDTAKLKEQVVKLSVEIASLGEMLGGKSKMNG